MEDTKLFDKINNRDSDSRREFPNTEKLWKKRYWNISDVAEVTGYAKGTLYNLVSDDLIPYTKKRGRLIFTPDEIQNWIEEGDLG